MTGGECIHWMSRIGWLKIEESVGEKESTSVSKINYIQVERFKQVLGAKVVLWLIESCVAVLILVTKRLLTSFNIPENNMTYPSTSIIHISLLVFAILLRHPSSHIPPYIPATYLQPTELPAKSNPQWNTQRFPTKITPLPAKPSRMYGRTEFSSWNLSSNHLK